MKLLALVLTEAVNVGETWKMFDVGTRDAEAIFFFGYERLKVFRGL